MNSRERRSLKRKKDREVEKRRLIWTYKNKMNKLNKIQDQTDHYEDLARRKQNEWILLSKQK